MNTFTLKNFVTAASLFISALSIQAQPFLESVAILNRYEDSYNTGGLYRLEKGPGSQVNYDMNVQWDAQGKILAFQSHFVDSLTNDRQYRSTRVVIGNMYTYTTEVREPSAGINNFSVQRQEFIFTDAQGNDTLITTTEYDPNFGFAMYSYDLRFSPKVDNLAEVEIVVNGMSMARMQMFYNANDQVDSVLEISFNSDPNKLSVYHYSGQQLDSISYFEQTIFLSWELTARTIMATGSHGFTTEAYAYSYSDVTNTWALDETMIFNRGMGISVEEEEELNDWMLFPNPAGDHINISGLTETSEYRLYSILGEEVQKGTVQNGDRINLFEHKAGIYLLSLKGKVKRVVIQ